MISSTFESRTLNSREHGFSDAAEKTPNMRVTRPRALLPFPTGKRDGTGRRETVPAFLPYVRTQWALRDSLPCDPHERLSMSHDPHDVKPPAKPSCDPAGTKIDCLCSSRLRDCNRELARRSTFGGGVKCRGHSDERLEPRALKSNWIEIWWHQEKGARNELGWRLNSEDSRVTSAVPTCCG